MNEQEFDFIDLLMEEFKDLDIQMSKDTMGNGDPALNLSHNLFRIYISKNGNVHIIPKGHKYITLGNIHESDILERIKKCSSFRS